MEIDTTEMIINIVKKLDEIAAQLGKMRTEIATSKQEQDQKIALLEKQVDSQHERLHQVEKLERDFNLRLLIFEKPRKFLNKIGSKVILIMIVMIITTIGTEVIDNIRYNKPKVVIEQNAPQAPIKIPVGHF